MTTTSDKSVTYRFNLLPAAVRTRLVELTRDPANPYRLFGDEAWRMGWAKYFFAVISLGGLAACVQFINDRTRMQNYTPWYDREVFFGAAVALFFLTISVLSIVYARRWPAPPYREGVYVVASGIVRLRAGEVALTPAEQLGRPTIVTHRTNGSYTHTSIDVAPGVNFRFDKGPEAEAAATRYLLLRKTYLDNVAAGGEALRQIDPFFECRVSGVWQQPLSTLMTQDGPVDTPVPSSAHLVRFLVSVGVALLFPAAAYFMLLLNTAGR